MKRTINVFLGETPKKVATLSVTKGEVLAMQLAQRAGITAAATRLV